MIDFCSQVFYLVAFATIVYEFRPTRTAFWSDQEASSDAENSDQHWQPTGEHPNAPNVAHQLPPSNLVGVLRPPNDAVAEHESDQENDSASTGSEFENEAEDDSASACIFDSNEVEANSIDEENHDQS